MKKVNRKKKWVEYRSQVMHTKRMHFLIEADPEIQDLFKKNDGRDALLFPDVEDTRMTFRFGNSGGYYQIPVSKEVRRALAKANDTFARLEGDKLHLTIEYTCQAESFPAVLGTRVQAIAMDPDKVARPLLSYGG